MQNMKWIVFCYSDWMNLLKKIVCFTFCFIYWYMQYMFYLSVIQNSIHQYWEELHNFCDYGIILMILLIDTIKFYYYKF